MNRLLRLCLLILGLVTGAANADPFAVDQAGQQRMLTQRMVKAYAQIGLDILAADAGWQLAGAVERFDYNLSWLERVVTGRAARDAVRELRASWGPLRQATLAEVSPQGLLALDRRAAASQVIADRLTRQLEEDSRQPEMRTLNLAARQRMLGQRLVKGYMLRLSGLDSPALRAEMKDAERDFGTALDTLIVRNGNSAAVTDKLHELLLQWGWLKAALETDGAENFGLIIAESGETVLSLCEDVVRLYLYEMTGRR
jgi:hypothetical protein